MKGYTFVYGVDGFGADIAPAYEHGVYLNFDKAFKRFMELSEPLMEEHPMYEEGYGIDFFPDEDEEMMRCYENDDFEGLEEELDKHRIKDVSTYCRLLWDEVDHPSIGQYLLVEVEIIE